MTPTYYLYKTLKPFNSDSIVGRKEVGLTTCWLQEQLIILQ